MRFFFHYNKPQSKSQKIPIISLHYQKTCHFVTNLTIEVPTKGKIKKRQPYFVMEGKADKIEIKGGEAYIS